MRWKTRIQDNVQFMNWLGNCCVNEERLIQTKCLTHCTNTSKQHAEDQTYFVQAHICAFLITMYSGAQFWKRFLMKHKRFSVVRVGTWNKISLDAI